MKKLLYGLCLCLLMVPAWAMSVAFINPGKHDELYWLTSANAMQAAADDLGIKLEMLYAERNHLNALEIARKITQRPAGQRPDYVIFSNDYGTAPEMLKLLNGAGIKTFMVFSGRSSDGKGELIGPPRGNYPLWLGSLEPMAEEAGYQTAKALIAEARRKDAPRVGGKMQLIAIGGDRSTPSSVARSDGMRRAVAEARDVQLTQEIFANWSRERAATQSEWLVQRYPKAAMVWAGNDLMAFGAMDTWQKVGRKPGKDVFFSGINTSEEAMKELQDGRLAALSGGHFICGAWALVMLYDYQHGVDFATEGLELQRPMFALFDRQSAAVFMTRFGKLDFSAVDFRKYSKVENRKLRQYRFGFRQLLQ